MTAFVASKVVLTLLGDPQRRQGVARLDVNQQCRVRIYVYVGRHQLDVLDGPCVISMLHSLRLFLWNFQQRVKMRLGLAIRATCTICPREVLSIGD